MFESRTPEAAVLALILAAATAAMAGSPSAGRIDDPADLISGPGAESQIGDFLLTNGAISVAIEAADHPHGDGLSGGNIIDASVGPHWEDQFGSHFTFFTDSTRQAVYDTVYVESDGGGGEAIVTAVGSDSGNPDITITTRYRLVADVPYVEIETTLFNNGESSSGYTAGDALSWDYGTHFVPGYGYDVTDATTFSTWLAGSSGALCYGYAVTAGTAKSTHGSLWSDPVVSSGNLSPGETNSFNRYFIVGGMGIASVSDAAHALRSEPVGTVFGTVTDQETGEEIEGATIGCEVGGVSLYTEARSDSSGGFSATLFMGDYRLVVRAASYLRTERPVTVSVSEMTEADFQLLHGTWHPDIGDTLTYVMRPILSIPTILMPGDDLTIEAAAPQSTTGWTAALRLGTNLTPLATKEAVFDAPTDRWIITAAVPGALPADVYDLVVAASDDVYDEVAHCVAVEDEMDDDFYFIHITDTHMPTHRFYYQQDADSDTTELDDMRAVIGDINLINPAFVLLTGDVVNEGELEDYLEWRSFTKTKRIMHELDVPIYIVAGNHDVGGWDSTPPPDGTSRRNWWRFFGWRRLYDPPDGDLIYTQNYAFDYGGVHFMGLEAYDNYDGWRSAYYGRESFTRKQMQWLSDQLASQDPSTPTVAFYHYDFGWEFHDSPMDIDCMLWGHIHSTSGQTETAPFDLSTENVCDGDRAMRLIRVKGDTIKPADPFKAGSSGQNLRVVYASRNDGTEARVAAQVINTHTEAFEHGLVRFHVQADSIPYAAEGGELLQTVVDGDVATCYVNVNMEVGTTEVSLAPTDPPLLEALWQSRPNPATHGTEISFVLAHPMRVKLDVFDVSGRKVVTLEDDLLDAGLHAVPWNLRSADGNGVATGVYFYRLKAGDETRTKKLVVVR